MKVLKILQSEDLELFSEDEKKRYCFSFEKDEEIHRLIEKEVRVYERSSVKEKFPEGDGHKKTLVIALKQRLGAVRKEVQIVSIDGNKIKESERSMISLDEYNGDFLLLLLVVLVFLIAIVVSFLIVFLRKIGRRRRMKRCLEEIHGENRFGEYTEDGDCI